MSKRREERRDKEPKTAVIAVGNFIDDFRVVPGKYVRMMNERGDEFRIRFTDRGIEISSVDSRLVPRLTGAVNTLELELRDFFD